MDKQKLGSFYRRVVIQNLRNHFVAGLLVVLPLVAAVWLLAWAFVAVDNLLQPVITYFFSNPIPGLGFAIFIALIYLVGLATSNFIGRKALQFADNLLDKLPVFRQIYTGTKQVIQSLGGKGINKSAFREVVFVEFPRQGMLVPAFVTNKFETASGNTLYAIYIPTTPVPTSGYFEIVSEDQLIRTRITVDSALRMIISAGLVMPARLDVGELLENRLSSGTKPAADVNQPTRGQAPQ